MLGLLPPELSSIREPEERAVEYLHYRQFFMVWETLERVVECHALEVPQMTKDTRAAWLSDYKVRCTIPEVFLYHVLNFFDGVDSCSAGERAGYQVAHD